MNSTQQHQSIAPIVRAIDVGFGNTKFTTSNFSQNCGCEIFPSIAPFASQRTKIMGSMLSAGDVIDVEVDGAMYTVGKDAGNAASTTTVRALASDFPMSPEHMALVKGALFKMNQAHIDLLVVGLPLNSYETYRPSLRLKMIGKHALPHPMQSSISGTLGDAVCEVRNVIVVPQAVGAFLNYTVPREINIHMKNQMNLILDVGRGTLDWYVTRGNQPILNRCGAIFGGTSKVTLAVANACNQKIKENLSAMDMLEESLYTKKSVHIAGKTLDIFEKYSAVIDASIRESVSAMTTGIGNMIDIKNVLVTGGGAKLFASQIKKAIPDLELIIDDNPVFSNVRGFQLAGEEWMRSQRKTA
jgi:plasmid segregation protein ParM